MCNAVVETLFRQLDSSYLIYEPTDMPSLKQLTRRLTDEKMCSESPKKYFGPFADEPHYDGVDHCLRFALRLMQDSQNNYHDNSDVPYNLGLQGACEVLAYLCKWHMIRLEEENWLADGMGDFQCSDLATWYTKACD
ncbi:hypothetical protein CMQ_1689 [Grosmannia clavigera kw1407]|uniref:Uncharacterized protein n=1 Tax=Grosmannia clavigera (strain kw1407 / UAMH 11150) TaxID=655863 RepID=F0XCS7_GROCL|nr:uncharacterized protein CMQ_1689 [Grosmannia clavigera kw1407]EFX04761.1 hypothetical protein CMQ_1689 [Grosmannia clavigera kw1407]